MLLKNDGDKDQREEEKRVSQGWTVWKKGLQVIRIREWYEMNDECVDPNKYPTSAPIEC